MSAGKKRALLDADFVVKAVISQKDADHHLLDLLMENTAFDFYCHEKTLDEVSNHDVEGASDWLRNKIKIGKITMVSDAEILAQLSTLFLSGANRRYRDYLRNSCEAFKKGYYDLAFASLEALPTDVDDQTFLSELGKCETAIGRGKSLGEKKSLVLLQMFKDFNPEEVYLFCSDDGDARAGVVSFASDVKCLSFLSVFHLFYSHGLAQEETEPYFASYENYLAQRTGQTQFKVYNQKGDTRLRVDCHQVFSEIYQGMYFDTKTGWLRYK